MFKKSLLVAAAALVGAGVLSVLVFPAIAVVIDRRLVGNHLATDAPQSLNTRYER